MVSVRRLPSLHHSSGCDCVCIDDICRLCLGCRVVLLFLLSMPFIFTHRLSTVELQFSRSHQLLDTNYIYKHTHTAIWCENLWQIHSIESNRTFLFFPPQFMLNFYDCDLSMVYAQEYTPSASKHSNEHMHDSRYAQQISYNSAICIERFLHRWQLTYL